MAASFIWLSTLNSEYWQINAFRGKNNFTECFRLQNMTATADLWDNMSLLIHLLFYLLYVT